MKNLTYLFIILLFFSYSCKQHKNSNSEFSKEYEGTIDNKIEIVFKIHKDVKNEITGTYFYKSVGTEINLKGNISDGKTTLKGFDKNGNNIDLFEGKFADDFSYLVGDWSIPDGSRKANFKIFEIINQGDKKNTVNETGYDTINGFEIIPVKLKEQKLKNICFTIFDSEYPRLAGKIDEELKEKLNYIFKKNFDKAVEIAKKDYGTGCDGGLFDEKENYPNVYAKYEVTEKNDNFISLIQYVIGGVGGMGNITSTYTYVLTADLKNKTIWTLKEFQISKSDISLINKKMKSYFNKRFSDQVDNLSYPLIENEKQLNNSKFCLRNDSIMLVLYCNPTGTHCDERTYVIPIDMIK